jgi:hypothetical protein
VGRAFAPANLGLPLVAAAAFYAELPSRFIVAPGGGASVSLAGSCRR